MLINLGYFLLLICLFIIGWGCLSQVFINIEGELFFCSLQLHIITVTKWSFKLNFPNLKSETVSIYILLLKFCFF